MTVGVKRIISFVLVVFLCLPICLGVLSLSGICANAAVSDTYTNELWLLEDYEYVLNRGERVKIGNSASPFAYETGTAYLPLSALCKYTSSSYTNSAGSVSVKLKDGQMARLQVGQTVWSGGEFLLPVIEQSSEVYVSILSAKELFGLNSTFYNDEIGLIVLSVYPISYSKNYSSLKTQIDTLSVLLFDRPTGSTIYKDLVMTRGSAETHPRILVDQQAFDTLAEVYETELNKNVDAEEDLYGEAVVNYMNQCQTVFNSLFTEDESAGVIWKSDTVRQSLRQPYYIYDENGNRLVGQSTYTYTDSEGKTVTLKCDGSGLGDGYDVGGRSAVDKHSLKLKMLAFAWQLTGDKKYADAFYLLAVELGKWEHWGEGHFLDVADGAVEFAIGFDWIYHAFDDDTDKRDEMAAILYEKGLMMGYYSIVFDTQFYDGGAQRPAGSYADYLHVSSKAGTTAWRTLNRDNNWQTVCGSGMIITALALMEYGNYNTEAKYVIQSYLRSNERCLLQYAPDGSYIESPGYWGYGTNTLILTLAALESSLGNDYGLKDIIGLHDSFYFAVGIADSDYNTWNYHDGGEGKIGCQSFYYASRLFNDPMLAALRDKQLFERGVSMDLMDILYYDPSLSGEADTDSLSLDFNFRGIDTATFRSSWEEEANFTGLHAGPGSVTHGDMDTGNFTLTMGGVRWILEPGTEDYNVPGFWQSSLTSGYKRYKLYGKSVEGHSTVVIRNRSVVTVGQAVTTYSTAYPRIDTFYSDENGGIAVTNMKPQYGKNCTSAKRGLLFTNSRNTVVIQDEIKFSEPTSLTAVFNLTGRLQMNDGRTITSTVWQDGTEYVLRATLLSDDPEIKFRKMGLYETVLGDTMIENKNGDTRLLDPVQRVVIEVDDATEYNVAVVFELIKHEDEVVGYSKVPMDQWTTCSDEWVKEENSDIQYTPTVYKYQMSDFVKAIMSLQNAVDQKQFGEIIRQTYIYTTDYDKNNKNLVKKVEEYMSYVDVYISAVKEYNRIFKTEFID